MDFNYFINNINKFNNFQVGGIDVQFELAPKIRTKLNAFEIDSKQPRKAAVLSLFYPNEKGETTFLLTKRADYDGTHAAQISFPGGKYDESDLSLKKTALRETTEEVGILSSKIMVFKQMTDVYIPPSNFIVTPYLGVLNETPNFSKNVEVAEIIHVLLSDFMNENCISTEIVTTSYAQKMVVPCYKLNNYTVWGATAMMLSEIRELIQKM